MKRTTEVGGYEQGATLLELTIACMLLGATLLSIATFRQRTLSNSQSVQRASFAQSRLLNLRREISTWPLDEVTVAAIESTPADDTGYLPSASWTADIEEIEEPIAGKRVVLALKWHEGQIERSCPSLMFWVKRP